MDPTHSNDPESLSLGRAPLLIKGDPVSRALPSLPVVAKLTNSRSG